MGSKEFIIFITVLILLLLSLTIIILFVVFSRRKNKLVLEKERIKEKFESELSNATIEIREETLRNISWELHDHIGQLMTLAKIQAQQIPDNPSKISEVTSIIGDALTELRSLSKVINPDVISNLNLIEAIKLEVDRFNRLKFIAAELKIVGDIFEIDARKEIILFRILQEFFINTLKHAQATLITIDIEFVIDCLYIKVKDNGKGFDQSESSDGIGLMNMKNRAHLIDAEFSLHSKLNEGTILTLQLNKKP